MCIPLWADARGPGTSDSNMSWGGHQPGHHAHGGVGPTSATATGVIRESHLKASVVPVPAAPGETLQRRFRSGCLGPGTDRVMRRIG